LLLLADRPASVSRDKDGWKIAGVTVPPDGTEVVAMARPDSLARLWLEEARDWLDRLAKEGTWLGAGGGTKVAGMAGFHQDDADVCEGEDSVQGKIPSRFKPDRRAPSPPTPLPPAGEGRFESRASD